MHEGKGGKDNIISINVTDIPFKSQTISVSANRLPISCSLSKRVTERVSVKVQKCPDHVKGKQQPATKYVFLEKSKQAGGKLLGLRVVSPSLRKHHMQYTVRVSVSAASIVNWAVYSVHLFRFHSIQHCLCFHKWGVAVYGGLGVWSGLM